jgi:hypothetical protein
MTVQSTLHPHPRTVAALANVGRSEFSERFLLTALDARFRFHHRNSKGNAVVEILRAAAAGRLL